MARFKRRRPRVVWLPVFGRDFSDGGEGADNFGNGVGGDLTVPNTGEIATEFQAVTFDYSDSASAEEGVDFRNLHDLVSGNAYRLRRLVGKFHAGAIVENNGKTDLPLVDVAAGFCVNRTDPDGNPLVNASIGSPQGQFGPLHEDAAEDPWIWRRRWILSVLPRTLNYPWSTLSEILAPQGSLGGQPQWPQTTADYGSVADGPHIDQKTARAIGTQERLFFWVQARVMNPSTTDTNNAHVLYQTDLRILASLRLNQGNRRNASR